VTREVREKYRAQVRKMRNLGVRNVGRADPASHQVAIVFAVLVGPRQVALGQPDKFDELGWFTPDALPQSQHSQLAGTLAMLTG
jgi:8-oxo-dGTP diphosphatase